MRWPNRVREAERFALFPAITGRQARLNLRRRPTPATTGRSLWAALQADVTCSAAPLPAPGHSPASAEHHTSAATRAGQNTTMATPLANLIARTLVILRAGICRLAVPPLAVIYTAFPL